MALGLILRGSKSCSLQAAEEALITPEECGYLIHPDIHPEATLSYTRRMSFYIWKA